MAGDACVYGPVSGRPVPFPSRRFVGSVRPKPPGPAARREGPRRHGERRWADARRREPWPVGWHPGKPVCCPADRCGPDRELALVIGTNSSWWSVSVHRSASGIHPGQLSAAGPKTRHGRSSVWSVPCACRCESHPVDRVIPGQERFSKSQGYPRNFPLTHRVIGVVHRPYTGNHTAGTRRAGPAAEVLSTGRSRGRSRAPSSSPDEMRRGHRLTWPGPAG